MGEQLARHRVQLCGRFVTSIDGARVEDRMPGRQGRLLFAYLASRQHRSATRDELCEALWPQELPSAPNMALSALVSKLRRVLGVGMLEGRSEIHLRLGKDAFVDVEAARQAVHEAESLVASRRWWDAYPGAAVAGAIARREFMRGEDAPWIDRLRHEMSDICVRAIEANVKICLAVSGAELPTAERLGRELTERAPFRESGYGLLMRSLEQQGNVAEAIRVYADLRERLHDELGTEPSIRVRELYQHMLESV
jgi:DNA-binding SARP family transcriptional activator